MTRTSISPIPPYKIGYHPILFYLNCPQHSRATLSHSGMTMPFHHFPVIFLLLIMISDLAFATTLEQVKTRGYLLCGVSQGVPGFSQKAADGQWQGLDVDVCKAVAVSALGDASKVEYVPLSEKQRFIGLQSGKVDFLIRNTTYSILRDVALKINWAGVNYYDGQAFLVPKNLGLKSVKDLDGAAICVTTGTTTELNLADYFRVNQLTYQAVLDEVLHASIAKYEAGQCDAFTTDQSSLAGLRLMLQIPDDHVVLPEVISKEPLGLVVRDNDPQWEDLVRWSFLAMVAAEELELTQANIDQALKSNKPAIRRFVGLEGSLGDYLEIANDWAYQIIKQIGNYGESFERHVGRNSPLGLERGLNDLWTRGGLMYSPPFR